MIEAYAMILWIGQSIPSIVFDKIAIEPKSWESCLNSIKQFDPGLEDIKVQSAISWCVEKDNLGNIIRVERVIVK